VLSREGVEREQLLLGLLEQPGDLGRRRAEPIDYLGDALAWLLASVGVEDLAGRGGDHRLLRPSEVTDHVSEEVNVMPTSA
jgi:hypothetical protein